MLQRMTKSLAVMATALVIGLTLSQTWAQQEMSAPPAAQPSTGEGGAGAVVEQPTQTAVEPEAIAQPPAGEGGAEAVVEQPTQTAVEPEAPAQPPAAQGSTEAVVEQPTQPAVEQEAAGQEPVAKEEAKEAVVEQETTAPEEEEPSSATSFYQQFRNVPPYLWGDLIDERRDYLARRRQAQYRDWSRPRRYWHNPWSAAHADALWAYSNARRDWSRDRSRYYRRDMGDARRWYTNPWSVAQHDWSKALTNYSRLRNLAMQEQFDSMRYGYGYPGGAVGPYGSPGGPFGPYSGFGGPGGPRGW